MVGVAGAVAWQRAGRRQSTSKKYRAIVSNHDTRGIVQRTGCLPSVRRSLLAGSVPVSVPKHPSGDTHVLYMDMDTLSGVCAAPPGCGLTKISIGKARRTHPPRTSPLATSLGTIHSRVCGVQRAAGGAPAAGSGLGHISLAISPGGPPPPASNASGEGEGCDPSSWGGYSSPDSILVIDPRAVAGNDRMMAVGLGRGGQRPQWLARDSRPWALATWLAPGSGPCGHRRPRRGPA